jgi:hypothetical protein
VNAQAEGTLRDARAILLAAVNGDGQTVDYMLRSYQGDAPGRDQERGELLLCLVGFGGVHTGPEGPHNRS